MRIAIRFAIAGLLFASALSTHAQTQARPAQQTNQEPRIPNPGLASYVGSERCGDCHPAIYARWSKTRMANVVTDPKVHPEVEIGRASCRERVEIAAGDASVEKKSQTD